MSPEPIDAEAADQGGVEPAPVRRLRLARLARQLSQDQLAEMAGISRQAVAGFEGGRFAPSLPVALRLSRALGTNVEDLFGDGGGPPPMTARWARRPARPGRPTRVALATVGAQTWAFPLDAAAVGAGFEAAAAVTTTGRRPAADEVAAVALQPPATTLVVAGCDPALPLLAGPLARQDPPVTLLWWQCSSRQALSLAAQGAVHAAGVHRPASTGTGGRAPAARRALPGGAAVIAFAAWDEGLAVSPSVADAVTSVADLVRLQLPLANREPGAEARTLLQRECRRAGVAAGDLVGWDTAVAGHLPVAAAIAAGLAAAGVTTAPAATAHNLPFVELATERFDLVVPRAHVSGVEGRALLTALGGSELRRQLSAVRGYDASACGTVVDSF